MARSFRRLSPVVSLAAFALLGLGAACDGPGAEKALALWFDAVQSLDVTALARVDASAPPGAPPGADGEPDEAYEEWAAGVREAIEQFETERDGGSFTADPRGYALVRAAGLGRGAFWQVERSRRADGAREVVLRVNFGYGEIPYGSLPPGTTVYLLGHPPGTVHVIELGRGRRVQMDVLRHAFFRARLVRRPGADGPGFAVESLAWAHDPPAHAVVDWIF